MGKAAAGGSIGGALIGGIADAKGSGTSKIGNFTGDFVGGITGAKQQAEAAERAAAEQAAGAQRGIDEQRRQFDALIELMKPYVASGQESLQGQRDILGLGEGGLERQQQAISAIEQSPYFQSMKQQGEGSLLQSAAATGGLRGGNMQAALGQFSPQLLNQLVQQQYQNLGGLTQLGQASAAGQAGQGMNMANSIAGLYGDQSAATAGGIIGKGSLQRTAFKDADNIAKTVLSFIASMKSGSNFQSQGALQDSQQYNTQNSRGGMF